MATGPLIAIVGETASGKSALALEAARRFNGEIICADSRTVYTGMDIGTAKPSKEEQGRIPHHLLDLITPDEKFNVAKFQRLSFGIIGELQKKGKLPILVGGTGLYIDSVIFNYAFSQGNSEKDDINPRHLKKLPDAQTHSSLRPNCLVIGLNIAKEELERRIVRRVESMLESGLELEVRGLVNKYGWEAEAMTGVGYREWEDYFKGTQSLEETKQRIIIATRQYAKRQRTWFKRNKSIQWISTPEEAYDLIEQFLANQAIH